MFAAVILIGAALLMLPISAQERTVTPFHEALFTATSAVCVTGLVVRDTASHWSAFGQAVLMVLIQIGGIFVVIVGVFIFAQNPVPQIRRNRAGKTSLWQDFASIFGLTIANFIMVIPYILAFFAVFKISGGDMADHTFGGFMRSLFVIAGFFGGAVAWWTLLAFVINLFRRRFRPRHMLTINHVAGLIIGILGIYTILSTFFDIFPNVGH